MKNIELKVLEKALIKYRERLASFNESETDLKKKERVLTFINLVDTKILEIMHTGGVMTSAIMCSNIFVLLK